MLSEFPEDNQRTGNKRKLDELSLCVNDEPGQLVLKHSSDGVVQAMKAMITAVRQNDDEIFETRQRSEHLYQTLIADSDAQVVSLKRELEQINALYAKLAQENQLRKERAKAGAEELDDLAIVYSARVSEMCQRSADMAKASAEEMAQRRLASLDEMRATGEKIVKAFSQRLETAFLDILQRQEQMAADFDKVHSDMVTSLMNSGKQMETEVGEKMNDLALKLNLEL